MEYSDIKQIRDTNPAIKVLRATKCPLILGFLFEVFKKNHIITISHEDLIIALAAYLEEYEPPGTGNGDIFDRSRQLIEEWCNDQNRYLRKYSNAQGTIVHELTSYIEKVFRWLDNLQPREYVGTESRFSDILRRLEELVERTQENPEMKIKELEKKKQEIEDEIAEIRHTGEVKTFSRFQIQERFEEISRNSRDLLADFKEVEQNFKKIVEHIYREEIEKNPSRGDILAYTLDANRELRESAQGKSFHSFWNFLIADSGDDKINSLVEKVFDILEEKSLRIIDNFLKKLKYHLHHAGRRVIDSNHILADKLNRVLSEAGLLQRHRIKELIREIKQIVFNVKDNPPDDERFMEIQGDCNINMSMERPLSFPEHTRETGEITVAPDNQDFINLVPLFNHFFVDKKRLLSNIRKILEEKAKVTLEEILEIYPVKKGLAEIIFYYDIASSSKKAKILDNKYFFIFYSYENIDKKIKAPEVVFFR
ncbi:MAG: DUF3375 domain-containing protein [Spirochaetales bacterium]|nr:DUF3375 domain-containing protein [Spirochaetales bacterium]